MCLWLFSLPLPFLLYHLSNRHLNCEQTVALGFARVWGQCHRVERNSRIFLTSQPTQVYKLLPNSTAQQSSNKIINDISMEDIVRFIKNQFDPKRLTVRERYNFWSEIQRKPSETVQKLASCIAKTPLRANSLRSRIRGLFAVCSNYTA